MKKWLVALLAIAAVVATGWFVLRDRRPSTTASPPVQSTTADGAASGTAAGVATTLLGSNSTSRTARTSAVEPVSATVTGAASATVVVALAVEPTFESTNLAPATILENMRTVIRQYGAAFGGNPVGTNPEITKALAGENPKHINFLKADGNRVNGNGELVDPWGTPYFFHQLSGAQMEIRSAGPDRVMYTPDDLVIK